MKNITMITIISIILIVVLLSVTNCAPPVSQEEYDSLKKELSNVQLQVQDLQNKLNEARINELQYQELKNRYDAQTGEIQAIKSDYDDLNASYEQLVRQDEARIEEIQRIQAEYDELNQEFVELKKQYDLIAKSQVFSEEEINQALFKLINEERKKNGLDELEWGVNLYWWARQNSLAMAEAGDYKYSSWVSVQSVIITAGQATLDGLVNGVMTVLKQRKHEFTPKFLSIVIKYGAVATCKSGDAYYITYMASTIP